MLEDRDIVFIPAADRARAVHQDVETSEARDGPFNRRAIGDIQRRGLNRPARRVHSGDLRLAEGQAGHAHVRPFRGQRFGDGPADARCSPRHQCGHACESIHLVLPSDTSVLKPVECARLFKYPMVRDGGEFEHAGSAGATRGVVSLRN